MTAIEAYCGGGVINHTQGLFSVTHKTLGSFAIRDLTSSTTSLTRNLTSVNNFFKNTNISIQIDVNTKIETEIGRWGILK